MRTYCTVLSHRRQVSCVLAPSYRKAPICLSMSQSMCVFLFFVKAQRLLISSQLVSRQLIGVFASSCVCECATVCVCVCVCVVCTYHPPLLAVPALPAHSIFSSAKNNC